jgi:NADH:ubiquinone oxidoreductase subunit 4 (subunit M)
MMIPNGDHETHGIYHQLGSLIVGILAVVFISRAYTEKGNAIHAWIFVIGTHFLIDLAVSMNQPLNAKETTIYLSGVLISGIVGLVILFYLHRKNQILTLFDYQGMAAKYPTLSTLFLITALGISGFPISTSFFGEDLIFVHIHQDQYVLATITALVFVINGITVIRLYAKLFLGTHPRNI